MYVLTIVFSCLYWSRNKIFGDGSDEIDRARRFAFNLPIPLYAFAAHENSAEIEMCIEKIRINFVDRTQCTELDKAAACLADFISSATSENQTRERNRLNEYLKKFSGTYEQWFEAMLNCIGEIEKYVRTTYDIYVLVLSHRIRDGVILPNHKFNRENYPRDYVEPLLLKKALSQLRRDMVEKHGLYGMSLTRTVSLKLQPKEKLPPIIIDEINRVPQMPNWYHIITTLYFPFNFRIQSSGDEQQCCQWWFFSPGFDRKGVSLQFFKLIYLTYLFFYEEETHRQPRSESYILRFFD